MIFSELRYAPALFRKPYVLGYWLLTAWSAWLAAVILALTVPTVITKEIDERLKKQYPIITEKKYLGLVKKTREDPKLAVEMAKARKQLKYGSFGIVGFLFLLHIPFALRGAGRLSARNEADGDRLSGKDGPTAIGLYKKALGFSVYPERSAAINEKIRLVGSGSNLTPQQEGTVMLTADGTMNMAGQTSYIGQKQRYRLVEALGHGAMGSVHRAMDTVLERSVAVKELLPNLSADADLVSRFRQEAKVLALLDHPNIVRIYDFIEETGRIWIIMELVDGGELAAVLKDRGPLSAAETAKFALPLAQAMEYAHSKGVIHRDFKPANVLLTRDGTPKITDFGLAKLAESVQHTHAGTIMGTPHYMSPEQAAGKSADARSDIYAFGVVLYRMLTGRVPFDGDMASVIAQHINNEPPKPGSIVSSVPPQMDELILSMLLKDPFKRIQDMSQVVGALKTFAQDK